MKKSGQIIFFLLFGIILLLSGCAPTFSSLNCTTPTETPQVTPKTMDEFAKQDINLMPKGNIIKIVLPTDRFFRNGSAQLKNNKKPALNQLAQFIQHNYGKTATVQIRGFSDTLSSDEQNQPLSLARARAVLAYFWTQGLDPDHLYALKSSNYLVGDPNNVDANAANRRVEITITAHCTSCC